MARLTAADAPAAAVLNGRHACLRPTRAADADALHAAQDADLWRYMSHAPADGIEAFRRHIADLAARTDMRAWTIFDADAPDAARGYACYLRTEPGHGCLEIGNVLFTAGLQRTFAASEAIFLLLRYAFDDLRFRRVEWKCDSCNEASRAAALRFGFTFEGVFRQHMIVRGENRDTAWFAMLDGEWPLCRRAFELWLAAENGDAAGRQRRTLATIRGSLATA